MPDADRAVAQATAYLAKEVLKIPDDSFAHEAGLLIKTRRPQCLPSNDHDVAISGVERATEESLCSLLVSV